MPVNKFFAKIVILFELTNFKGFVILPNEYEIKKQITVAFLTNNLFWWRRWGSNPRPFGCQPNALAN
jgi:hypothetical protein